MFSVGEILLVLLATLCGFALFHAGREFVKGFRAASDTQANSDPRGARAERKPEEEHGQQPAWRNEKRSWHEVLGLVSHASNEEIKTAYRCLMVQYHPDRVTGLGEEIRLLAENHTKQINAAYAEARRLRGF